MRSRRAGRQKVSRGRDRTAMRDRRCTEIPIVARCGFRVGGHACGPSVTLGRNPIVRHAKIRGSRARRGERLSEPVWRGIMIRRRGHGTRSYVAAIQGGGSVWKVRVLIGVMPRPGCCGPMIAIFRSSAHLDRRRHADGHPLLRGSALRYGFMAAATASAIAVMRIGRTSKVTPSGRVASLTALDMAAAAPR